MAFSLTNKKKKRKTATTQNAAALHDFGVEEGEQQQQPLRPERTSPLVIPLLSDPTSGPLAKLKKEDAAAAQQLMDSAAHHFSSQSQTAEGTNFSAQGSLTIESGKNTLERNNTTDAEDAEQLKRDLQNRAEDVPVDSTIYQQIPIAEFGAALLRGMGWKGDEGRGNSGDIASDSLTMPRPHRLGLGATPKLPEKVSSGKMKRPDQVQRDARLAQQQQEYVARRQKQVRLDKQQTLQEGSIVVVRDGERRSRARMVQMMGVPGLNRVLIQYEGETTKTSVKKGDVVLVTREELNDRPFREPRVEKQPKEVKKEDDNEYDRNGSDGKRIKREDGDYDRNGGDRKRIKREEDESGRDRDRRRQREQDEGRRGDDRDRNRDRNRKSDRRSDEEKRRRSESDDVLHWLIPNIRVRVVSKKLSSLQYKQKGLVLDVTHGGAYATLHMSDGQILDRVPERYLETALPKVGGNAIILTGKHRLQKGKLLERGSESGKGVIQLFEDMNLVKLSLDDIAEWCGPLDDDMEL